MLWVKALHVISVIAWMAGLFYLPRLFVYHVQQRDKPDVVNVFKVMEKKLYRIIIQPAMVASWFFGVWQLVPYGFNLPQPWLFLKLFLVVAMTVFHFYLGICVQRFAHDRIVHSEKYYRLLNEVPTLLMMAIVILAVLKPVF